LCFEKFVSVTKVSTGVGSVSPLNGGHCERNSEH